MELLDYLLHNYLDILMSQRIQPLSFLTLPNLTHNFMTTQFILFGLIYGFSRTLTLVHSYHDFIKCRRVIMPHYFMVMVITSDLEEIPSKSNLTIILITHDVFVLDIS